MTLSDDDIQEIRGALHAELERSRQPLTMAIRSVRLDAGWLVVGVGPLPNVRTKPLDESLEGAGVWWPEPKGGGEVFLIRNEEEDELWLSETYGAAPRAGKILQIYPPPFLGPLIQLWHNPSWTKRIKDCVASCPASANASPIYPDRFPYLRSRQKAAFGLVQQSVSFLWGPPGTGKTTTLGALLAALLETQPSARILLISSTNSAVDQAMAAVDDKLAELGIAPTPGSPRSRCKRIGQNFEAGIYERRRHLLPHRDKAAIQALINHLSSRPSDSDASAFARWRATEDELRRRLRQQNAELYSRPGLVAMTSTRAAFDFEMLEPIPPFDLLVIDEASQVSLAYALALLPLGRSALFAGDPAQLSPIVQEQASGALRWLGSSIFAWQEHLSASPGRVRLNEQSRMAATICAVVGSAFYEDDLVVCTKASSDPKWQNERRLEGTLKPFTMVPVMAAGRFDAHWGGPVREESAEHAVQIIRKLLASFDPSEIVLLTPFRSQRALIKKRLRSAQITGVKVSTVHRAQGSEKLAVVFDPVDAGNNFLNSALGRRLINVALSRAKAIAVLLVSSHDVRNPALAAIARKVGHVQHTPLLCELGANSDFPWVLQGQTFGYLGSTLRFKKFNDDRSSVFVEHIDGPNRGDRFNLGFMRQKCPSISQCPLKPGSSSSRCVK